MPVVTPDMKKWEALVSNIQKSEDIIRIGMVGKCVDLGGARYTQNERLKCAGFAHQKKVKLEFIDAEEIEKIGIGVLKNLNGICIPGGFGTR